MKNTMANEKHLSILMQGVEAWNQWRRENPKIKPNLRKHLRIDSSKISKHFADQS
jgi:hypothetical protein